MKQTIKFNKWNKDKGKTLTDYEFVKRFKQIQDYVINKFRLPMGKRRQK